MKTFSIMALIMVVSCHRQHNEVSAHESSPAEISPKTDVQKSDADEGSSQRTDAPRPPATSRHDKDKVVLVGMEWKGIHSGHCLDIQDSCFAGVIPLRDEFGHCWQLVEPTTANGAATDSAELSWVSPGSDGRIGTEDDTRIITSQEFQECRANGSTSRGSTHRPNR